MTYYDLPKLVVMEKAAEIDVSVPFSPESKSKQKRENTVFRIIREAVFNWSWRVNCLGNYSINPTLYKGDGVITWGVLPYISYIVCAAPKGMGFEPFWSENGYRFCPLWTRTYKRICLFNSK